MAFCSQCGADVTGVVFCAKCGAPVEGAASSGGDAAPATPPPSSGGSPNAAAASAAGSQDNLMGALAYVTVIPAIVFLLIEPYKNSRFIRFHSFQCIFFTLAAIALNIATTILSVVLSFVGGIGVLLGMLGMLVSVGIFILWIVLVMKAYQGEEFRLPIIGDLAAKQA
jgi:uncharacterized membrane protein